MIEHRVALLLGCLSLIAAALECNRLGVDGFDVQLMHNWLPFEGDYEAVDPVTIRSCDGTPVGRVPRMFAQSLMTSQQGILLQNDTVVYMECSCPGSSFSCFNTYKDPVYSYGMLANSKRALKPMVSLFVGQSTGVACNSPLSVGDTVFASALVGMQIPGTSLRHNGCLVVDKVEWGSIPPPDSAALFVFKKSNSAVVRNALQGADVLELSKTTCTPIILPGNQDGPVTPVEPHSWSSSGDSTSDVAIPSPVVSSSSSNVDLNPIPSSSSSVGRPVEGPRTPGEPCIQEQNCHMPDCRCFTLDAPGNLPASRIPFFIVLTLDDINVDSQVTELIGALERDVPRDAGGCHLRSTYFVSWAYQGMLQDMVALRRLSKAGNHIGLHTFWHNTGANTPAAEWRQQLLAGQCASKLAGVSSEGARTPYTYWNADYMRVLGEMQIPFDSSHIINTYAQNQRFVWPNTLNWGAHQWVKDISSWFNPAGDLSTPAPGVWEQYMTELMAYGSRTETVGTSMEPPSQSSQDVLNILRWNFDLHYNSSTRAPFGVYWHLSSLGSNTNLVTALGQFLTSILQEHPNDIYFATIPEVISWVKNPVPLPEFRGFGCASDAFVTDPDPCDGQGSVTCAATVPSVIPIGVQQPIATSYSVCGSRCPDWTLGSSC